MKTRFLQFVTISLIVTSLCTFLQLDRTNAARAQSNTIELTPTPARPTLTPIPSNSLHQGLWKIWGVAFEDVNQNGKRDAGEPLLSNVLFKVTDGGSWYVCGQVGDDSSFGVMVNPGIYYVIPIGHPGYRVTTPRIKVDIPATQADSHSDIGFVKDMAAENEPCDQYHPARP